MIFNDQTPRCKHKYCYVSIISHFTHLFDCVTIPYLLQGLVKPDIVFFGEDLPQRFHSLQLPDFSKCDLLIIMGTSLEVRQHQLVKQCLAYTVYADCVTLCMACVWYVGLFL